jgi:UDPglucose 6-dehydrogenase
VTKEQIGVASDPVIGVLGLGHVGLPTALGFAELGWSVVGADDDREKVEQLARGEPTFYEPGLEELLLKHLDSGSFRLVHDVPEAIRASTVLFVCVGTPQREDGATDLSQIERVARTIAKHSNGYKLIVEKSTTPVSTAEHLKHTVTRYIDGDNDFDVAVNPEFLREGTAVHDFFNPDRIVLGVESGRARELLLRIYRPLLDRQCAAAEGTGSTPSTPDGIDRRLVITNLNTAELIKHCSNAFLAMKVSFINLVADLSESAGADVEEVALGLGLDPRIGPDFLRAGVGFGGYCLPKDLRAFIRIGEDHGVDMALLKSVSEINEKRVDRVVSTLRRALWVIEGKVLAVWGLAFKPGTDDIRDAPSLKVVARLLQEGATLRLHDPKAIPEFQRRYPEGTERIVYCDSPIEAAEHADAVLLLTDWPQYREVDLSRLRDTLALPVIVDGRNFLDPERVRSSGFEYYGMGR